MMRTIVNFGLLIFGIIFFSCNTIIDRSKQKSDISTTSESDSIVAKMAICLWDGAGLREEPGRKSSIKYLTTIYFGERVEMIDSINTTLIGSRTYMKVRLSDGQEGWVNQYLFVQGDELVAITKDAEMYRRPDQMTFKDEFFSRGEIAVLEDQKENWIKLVGIERTKSGWIMIKNNFSRDPKDVQLALKLNRAERLSSKKEQKEKLASILEDEKNAGSKLFDLVVEKVKNIGNFNFKKQNKKQKEVIFAKDKELEQLLITVPKTSIYKNPNEDDNDILKYVDEGTLCKVIQKGPLLVLNEEKDYWYKIEYEGIEGWVFGINTSKSIEAK